MPLARWSREPPGAGGRPLRTYCIEVSLHAADLGPELQGLGQLPTALSLPPADARRLLIGPMSGARRHCHG